MNHEHQLAELLRIYGADPHDSKASLSTPENEWPEAQGQFHAEQTLDQILNQDAIRTESAQLQSAIEETVFNHEPASGAAVHLIE